MSNSKENQKVKNNNEQLSISILIYNFLYNIEYKQQVRDSAYYFLRALNIVFVFVTYLSLPNIQIISLNWLRLQVVASMCLIGFAILLMIQIIVGIAYNKQIFLKIQFSIFRNVLFYIGVFSLTCSQEFSIGQLIIIVIAMFCVIGMSTVIGKQSYSKKLLKDEGIPIDNYLLIYECLLCIYQSKMEEYKNITLFLMVVASLMVRLAVFESSYRRSTSLEYIILRIGSSLNILYTISILFHFMFDVLTHTQKNYSSLALIALLIVAELTSQFPPPVDPIPSQYFNGLMPEKEFMEITQSLIDSIRHINSQSQLSTKINSLYSFYYDHASKCCNADCEIPHQVNPVDLQKSAQKQLCSKVYKVIEKKFIDVCINQPENVSLKLSFINFYIMGFPNRYKILRIINELQALSLNWSAKLHVHIVRRQLTELEVVELLDTMKMDDYEDQFSHKINVLMRLLVDFWAQFLEERVDFEKVIKIGEKLMPAMESVDMQWTQTLKTQSFTAMRAMKLYSQYCLQILNDQAMSQKVTDYITMLHKKYSQSHEVQYLSSDSETALVAISLNTKHLGKIKLINNQACYLFNYEKAQMQKLFVNDLMPKLYADSHDQFLKVFLTFENKKVNTDNRLLVGKKSDGFLFQIFLQLQKSITTANEELIFIANIQVAKVNQAMFLIICNEQGHIMDTNSTFNYIFIKNHDKRSAKHNFTNIQDLLPNFFQSFYEEDDGGFKVMKELFDTLIFGVMEIKFQITKIVLPGKPQAGYLIKGYRVQEEQTPFFNNLSLTAALSQMRDNDELQGMKMHYDPSKNEYLIDQSLQLYQNKNFGTEFTIPFMRIEELAGVFGDNFEQKQERQSYDHQIKTIRFCRDHFERVEDPESFESEIDMEQKMNNGAHELLRLKQQMNQKMQASQKQGSQLINFAISLIIPICLILFYLQIVAYHNYETGIVNTLQASYSYRGQLAEYISYLEGQRISTNPLAFFNRRQAIKNQVIDNINESPLPQAQKQQAMKIIYLKQNENLAALINNSVFSLAEIQISDQNKILLGLAIVIMITIGMKVGFSFIFLRWHQSKLLKIFSLFLSQPQKKIIKIHKRCLNFLKNSSESEIMGQSFVNKQEDEEQSNEDDNPHLKLKKFKNLTIGVDVKQIGKINAILLLFLLLFIISMVIYLNLQKSHEKHQESYSFSLTVMPQYSLQIMKAFFYQAQQTIPMVTENFDNKYQNIEYSMIQHIENNIEKKFLNLMYDNACKQFSFTIPLNCQEYAGGTMEDGVSKIMNWVSSNLREINSVISNENLQDLESLSIIVFKMVKPVLQSVSQSLKKQFLSDNAEKKNFLLILVIILVTIIGIDFIYNHHYAIKNRIQRLESSRCLVKLLPHEEEKKGDKKPNQYSL